MKATRGASPGVEVLLEVPALQKLEDDVDPRAEVADEILVELDDARVLDVREQVDLPADLGGRGRVGRWREREACWERVRREARCGRRWRGWGRRKRRLLACRSSIWLLSCFSTSRAEGVRMSDGDMPLTPWFEELRRDVVATG